MTKEAFKKHCENVFGPSPMETGQCWKELFENPKVDRDNKGFQGRLQLWAPIGARRAHGKEQGVEPSAMEGSNPIKNPKQTDLQILKDNVRR